MPETSALGPINPDSISGSNEVEKSAPWVVRKLVGSVPGRIAMSSYESLRAAGTNVICLSPWGDSSPFFLPCIRFRDIAVHTVIAATGGIAAVAAPVMGPVSDAVVTGLGDTILVELGVHVGFDVTAKIANDLILEKTIGSVIPVHSNKLETTAVKVLLITLKYKHIMDDAALGFYRSSLHSDVSFFTAVKDYLRVEKGWFSPYLFATARRPIIPRNMKPDIVFCHGPFLSGDYRVGETLLGESASIIALCDAPATPETDVTPEENDHKVLSIPSLSSVFSRSQTPSPELTLTPLPRPPAPRRMIIIFVGLKPHRKMWALSARPEESVINYILLNGCPGIVVPVKLGTPLVAWDGLTVQHLWAIDLPGKDGARSSTGKFEGIVDVIFEYVDLCVDWERVKLPSVNSSVAESADAHQQLENSDSLKDTISLKAARTALKDAVTLLVAAAIRSKTSKPARKELDPDRSGIAMWRIP